jgi:hypothetical protein
MTGSRVDPRVSLDAVTKEKLPVCARSTTLLTELSCVKHLKLSANLFLVTKHRFDFLFT